MRIKTPLRSIWAGFGAGVSSGAAFGFGVCARAAPKPAQVNAINKIA